MTTHTCKLKGVKLIEYVGCDSSMLYNHDYAKEQGIRAFFSYHYSISLFRKHILRGFYIQDIPWANNQILKCVEGSGKIVLLDMRDGINTFGQCETFILTPENNISLYIPAGIAYAVLSLAENTEIVGLSDYVVSYITTVMINPFDNRLGLVWPDDVVASMECRHTPKYDELNHYFW